MMMVPINIRPTRTSSLFFMKDWSRSGNACEASYLKVSRSGSTCEASCLKIGCEEKRGERIEHQNRNRRHDHRLRGAAPDALRADVGGVTLVGAEKGDRPSEQHRLDYAVHDLEGCERQPETFGEGSGRHVCSSNGGEKRGADAYSIRDDGESGNHDESGDEPRHHQVGDGIVRERFERVDLLRHAHRAYLSRDTRANPAREHESGEQRTELQNYRLA